MQNKTKTILQGLSALLVNRNQEERVILHDTRSLLVQAQDLLLVVCFSLVPGAIPLCWEPLESHAN